MRKLYLLRHSSPKQIAVFKVLDDTKNYIYGEYIYPKHLKGKTSSIVGGTLKRCFDMDKDMTPCIYMEIVYDAIKDNPKYKAEPLKYGKILYEYFFQTDTEYMYNQKKQKLFRKIIKDFPELKELDI